MLKAHTDTYLFDRSASCQAQKTIESCLTARGGFYDQSSSSSAKTGDPLNHIADDAAARYTKDNVVFSDASSLQSYDFSVLDKLLYESRSEGFMGVGANSSFIRALQRAGAVSSRSYSIFWGDDFTDEPHDGFVTFGGYDTSIIDGTDKVTKAFNRSKPACAENMIVKLTEMHLSNEHGAVANIFDKLGTMYVCVVPSMRNIMALPKQYGNRMIKGMGAKRADDLINGKFNGTLTNTAVITPESA